MDDSTFRILVVSDDPRSRRALRKALASADYDVYDARIPAYLDAFNRCRPVGLVIVDSNSAGKHLVQICQRIHAESGAALFVLTNQGAEQGRIEILDAGADEVLVRPVSVAELLAHVRVCARRMPASRAQFPMLVRLGEVEIDLTARRVVSTEREIHLTPKEFELLDCMVAHPNATLPHAVLLRAVWGCHSPRHTSCLRVFINQLRRKIEMDPSHPKHLITEPWVGYRLEIPGRR